MLKREKRYGDGVIIIKVMDNMTISNQHGYVTNSVGLNADSMRIVLTWGSAPSDLDSHLLLTGNSSYHIDYSNKTPYGANANLDVDDTSAYGPETITISSFKENTVYKYYIFNFSRNSLQGLANSNAVINIYMGTSSVPYYTLYVPQGSGYYWNVFEYNTATNEFTIINAITSSAP